MVGRRDLLSPPPDGVVVQGRAGQTMEDRSATLSPIPSPKLQRQLAALGPGSCGCSALLGGVCVPPRGMGWLGTHGRALQPLFPTCTVWPRSSHAHSGSRLGKLQAATADFVFKPDFNLERFGQPNIEQNSRFTAQLMASSRAVRIGPDNLIPGSGRRYP